MKTDGDEAATYQVVDGRSTLERGLDSLHTSHLLRAARYGDEYRLVCTFDRVCFGLDFGIFYIGKNDE